MSNSASPVHPGAVSCRWIGQGGFIVADPAGHTVVIDPYLSETVELARLSPIPVRPEEVKADLVLCTHADTDHTDPGTIPLMSRVRRFAGPTSVVDKYKELGIAEGRTVSINRGEQASPEGIPVRAVYAKHTPDSVGFVIDLAGIRLYITGDSEYDDLLGGAARFAPDVMLICINGRWGNMGIAEAVQVTRLVRPQLVIPMHYGMFAENTADPLEFVRAIEDSGLPVQSAVLEFDRPYLIKKEGAGVVCAPAGAATA